MIGVGYGEVEKFSFEIQTAPMSPPIHSEVLITNTITRALKNTTPLDGSLNKKLPQAQNFLISFSQNVHSNSTFTDIFGVATRASRSDGLKLVEVLQSTEFIDNN